MHPNILQPQSHALVFRGLGAEPSNKHGTSFNGIIACTTAQFGYELSENSINAQFLAELVTIICYNQNGLVCFLLMHGGRSLPPWKHPTAELREQYESAFAKETVIGQYTFGTQEGSVSPDGYSLDLYYAATIPDYAEKQSDLIFDYQNNVKLYPAFQKYLREHQPKLLAIWGKDDPSFIWAGAEAFRKDLPEARIIPVNSGHFALENCCREIAEEIKEWEALLLRTSALQHSADAGLAEPG